MFARVGRSSSGNSDSQTFASYEQRVFLIVGTILFVYGAQQFVTADTKYNRILLSFVLVLMLFLLERIHHSFRVSVYRDCLIIHTIRDDRTILFSHIRHAEAVPKKTMRGERTLLRLDYVDGEHDYFDALSGTTIVGSPSWQIVHDAAAEISRRIAVFDQDPTSSGR